MFWNVSGRTILLKPHPLVHRVTYGNEQRYIVEMHLCVLGISNRPDCVRRA